MFISITCDGLTIAAVMPAWIAKARNAAFTNCLSGRPNDILDSPHIVAVPSSSRQYRIVSMACSAACGLAPTVLTRPSTNISFRPSPCACASAIIVRIISFFSSRSFGSPLSERGRRINIAPYFLAAGNSRSIFPRSSDTELISARPG